MKDHFECNAERGDTWVYFTDGLYIKKSVDDLGEVFYSMVNEERLTEASDYKPPNYEKRYQDLKKHYNKKLELHNKKKELDSLKIQLDHIEKLLNKFNKENR